MLTFWKPKILNFVLNIENFSKLLHLKFWANTYLWNLPSSNIEKFQRDAHHKKKLTSRPYFYSHESWSSQHASFPPSLYTNYADETCLHISLTFMIAIITSTICSCTYIQKKPAVIILRLSPQFLVNEIQKKTRCLLSCAPIVIWWNSNVWLELLRKCAVCRWSSCTSNHHSRTFIRIGFLSIIFF